MEQGRPPLSEREQREIAVLEEYGTLLKPHIEASNGGLVLLDANTRIHGSQRLDCHVVEGDPKGAGMVEIVATSAEKRFPQLIDILQKPDQQEVLTKAGEVLQRGDNIMLVTNHGDLIDIAIAYGGIYVELSGQHYPFKSGMVISKIISRLGYVFDADVPAVPAVEALQLACDDVLLSFPRTPSMERSWIFRFIPEHMRDHNNKIRRTIKSRQGAEDGYLLGIAGSGATDKALAADPSTFYMGGLSEGTIKMMCQENTYVLPMAIWRGDEDITAKLGNVRAVKSAADAHSVMSDIADSLNEIVPGKNFRYSQ